MACVNVGIIHPILTIKGLNMTSGSGIIPKLKPSDFAMRMLGLTDKNKESFSDVVKTFIAARPFIVKPSLVIPGSAAAVGISLVVSKMSDVLAQKCTLKQAGDQWSKTKGENMPASERVNLLNDGLGSTKQVHRQGS